MGRAVGEGLRSYYKGKIEELEILIKDKSHNLHRLEAQRNELNAHGASDRCKICVHDNSACWFGTQYKATQSTGYLVHTFRSANAEGGAQSVARARIVRGRGYQGHGKEQSPGQGMSNTHIGDDCVVHTQHHAQLARLWLNCAGAVFRWRRASHTCMCPSQRLQVHPEGKYVVDIDKEIDISKLTAGVRVALRNDSYQLHLLLPTKVDPLVSLMKVEKVPDSTYDMIGGCDQQIKEIKEVRTV
eukprot:107350-Chlamydomonas_euryale.AAC.6